VRDIQNMKFWEPPTSAFQIAEFTFQDLKADIREAWFWDRLDVPPPEAGEMTAYEFGKRLERALQLFGPTLGRLYREALNDLIQRCFNLMYRKGAFNKLPQALLQADTPLDIEYDSPMARAQKAEEVNAIDAFMLDILATSRAQLEIGQQNTVADLIDWDEGATMKSRRGNIPERLLLSDAKVKSLRDERAERMNQAREAELAAQQAGTLKDASNTDAGKLRALTGS
jgi:hypothetical protein